MKKYLIVCVALVIVLLSMGCASIPRGASVVENFDKEKYLGKWYEIARIDFEFEKDLNNTTAEYSLNDNGFINVVNRGFNYKKQKWQESTGVAKFQRADTVGALEVSFFGPFFAPYNIIRLDGDYQFALIAGSNLKYLWILSREPSIPEDIKKQYLEKATELGYKTDDLIWVEHNS